LPTDEGDVSLAVSYPIGASMYVDIEYVDKVGLLDPCYFLYCEEMDWAERGRRQGYRPLVALKSRLRHKEGASTGSRGGVRNKSLLSEWYGVINRLRITRKFWPHYLPMVWASLVLVIFDRLVHGEMARAGLVLQLMFSPSHWLRDQQHAPDPRMRSEAEPKCKDKGK
jgi:GT2 family glycosyltransferase